MATEPIMAASVPEPEADQELLEELALLELPRVRKTCPDCLGAGDGEQPCQRCGGTGEVEVPQVTNYDQALTLAEAISALANQERERREAFERRIARLQAEMEAALAPLRRRREYLEGLLVDYHRRILEADKRAKTIPLAGGVRLQARTAQKWYYDDAALTEWLRRHAPHLVRTKYEPIKTDLKKAVQPLPDGRVVLQETGEIVEGVQVATETTFTVKVETDDAGA